MTTTTDAKRSHVLTGLRLHARRLDGGAPQVQQLLDLQQREVRHSASVQAALDLARTAKATVEAIPGQVRQQIDEVAGIAVELGLALAREIVGDALAKGLFDPTAVVVRCLRDCVHGSSRADLVVRLHPDDLAGVQAALQTIPAVADEVAAARFVGDASVARGSVRAETGAGRLQCDPREVLERMCAEVRREASS